MSGAELPERFFKDHAEGGLLSTLTPLGAEEVKALKDAYQGISQQYLDFIAHIGVGKTTNGLYIYSPYSADELTSHASFQIYNAPASRRLFGLLPAKPRIPPKLICVSDSGASWRYCLDLNKADEVVCFEMFDARVSKESDDFFSFVEEQVFNIEEE